MLDPFGHPSFQDANISVGNARKSICIFYWHHPRQEGRSEQRERGYKTTGTPAGLAWNGARSRSKEAIFCLFRSLETVNCFFLLIVLCIPCPRWFQANVFWVGFLWVASVFLWPKKAVSWCFHRRCPMCFRASLRPKVDFSLYKHWWCRLFIKMRMPENFFGWHFMRKTCVTSILIATMERSPFLYDLVCEPFPISFFL